MLLCVFGSSLHLFAPHFPSPFTGFLYMCALADGAECALVRRPRPSGSSCLTLVTAAGWWFNQLQKRSLLNSDNLVLSRSGHCCCCWFNQLQKRLLNSKNLWHFSWEGVHGSLGSLVILLVQPVVTNCKRNPMSIETTGIFLPGKGFLAHSGLHNSCSYHRSQLQKKLFLATT